MILSPRLIKNTLDWTESTAATFLSRFHTNFSMRRTKVTSSFEKFVPVIPFSLIIRLLALSESNSVRTKSNDACII